MSDIKFDIGCFAKSVLLDDSACSGADPMDWMASRQSRLAKQLLGGAEQRAFFLVTFLCTGKEKLPAPPQEEWKLCFKKYQNGARTG
jgi:hypothetical protein